MSDHEYQRYFDDIPTDPQYRQAWVDAAPNACERLAREWAVESKSQGRGPDAELDPSEVRRRVAALIAVMGGGR